MKLKMVASLAMAGFLASAAAAQQAQRVPVLLELFTSEGCSSCPPADRLLSDLDQKQPVAGADLVVLSEHVDYWDKLGWKDPASSEQYTQRQQAYAAHLSDGEAYTPQLVVDGESAFVGSNRNATAHAVEQSLRRPKIALRLSAVERQAGNVVAHVEWQPGQKHAKAQLWAVLADDKTTSHVMRGENAGRALVHTAVARVLRPLGDVDTGQAFGTNISVPTAGASSGALRLIVFVQEPSTGRVLGTASVLTSGT